MAHVYYHGVGNSGGSSAGDGVAGLMLCIIVVLALITLWIAPMILFSAILCCVAMAVLPQYWHEENVVKYWPLSFLYIWSFGVYNSVLYPSDIHGWYKIGYYLGVVILTFGSTYGVDRLLKYLISRYLPMAKNLYQCVEYFPLVLTYMINFDWTNKMVMKILMNIWHFIEWVGSLAG